MGDAADSALEYFWTMPFPSRKRRRTFQSGTGAGMWRISGGEIIRMRDMTEEHIQAAIKICEQNGNSGKKKDLLAELKRRSKQ